MRAQGLLLLLFLQHSKPDPACESLRCFVDYIRTLTCMWDTPSRRLHRLTASWDCGHSCTCSFLPTFRNASHTQHTCSSGEKLCVFSNTFAVTALLDGAPAVPQECGPFLCHENIKPRPPFNLTAVARPDGYNISWESGYLASDYLHGQLQYQLRYRQKGRPWSLEGGPAGGQKLVLQDTPTLWLLPLELEGGVEYELQVRAGLTDTSDYEGTWSDWSPPSGLRTPPRGTAGARWVVMLLLAFSLIVAFLCKHQRPWKKLEGFIPSPAPFFQTLYLVHNGDFKKWVGASCPRVTLDAHDCGTAVPEVFRVSTRPLPPAPACPAAPPAFADQSPGATLEPAYGHLSIDTVTVADTCGPEPEDYRCLPVGSGPPATLLLLSETPPPLGDAGSSGREGACLPPRQAPAPPEQGLPLHGLPPRGPAGASSPPATRPFWRESLSPAWAADGDPGGDSLDLDTVDSGFADSDCCGSPVDCECPGRRASCATPGEEDGAVFLPSYLKQWVAGHTAPLAERS